jgi:hypothetical protein
VGVLERLFPARYAERRRWEEETWRVFERAPSTADIAVRDGTFARWHGAIDAVRRHLRTADGHLFLDVLEGPAAEAEDRGYPHREGPLPGVDVLAGVLTALGEECPRDLLEELVAADAAVVALPWVSGLVEAGAQEGVRAAITARLPALTVTRDLPEDAAHRAFREEVDRTLERLGTTGVVTPRASRALSSVRWWPGRDPGLPPQLARDIDPLGLAGLGRHLEAFARSYPRHVDEAAHRLERLARGEGIPPVEPASWILSALRHLVAEEETA